MKNRTVLKLALVGCVLSLCPRIFAATVTNWHTFRDVAATTLSGQGTGSPALGSTNLTGSAAFFIGYFQALSLTNVGDRITYSYQISFSDLGGMATPGDNFRFAIWDLNGQTPVAAENTGTAGIDGQTDDWRGYYFGQKGGGGAGINGSLRERIGPVDPAGNNIFSATGVNSANMPSRGAIGGAAITLLSSTGTDGPVFTGVMAVERISSGVAVAGYFGGNGATNTFAANDAFPTPTNYAAVGYLNAGPLSCDQFNLQNATISYAGSNALAFVSQPINVTTNPGQLASFSASWTGSGIIPFIQWRENGADIAGATNPTYTISAVSSSQNNYTYSVVVSNVFGDSITSTNGTLTVIPDTNAPIVLSVSSLLSNSLNVVFSEQVDSTSAQDPASYTLAGNSFSQIILIGGSNVQLTADNLITTNYTLTVQGVKDGSGNTNVTTNLLGIAHGFQDSLPVLIQNGLGFAFNDKEVVYGGGADIFTNSDQFQYVYKTASGNFDIAVRVESLVNTDANAKAGLMARTSTFFDSRNIMIEATPARFILQYRTNAAGATSFALSSPRPPTAFPNCWVRLVRSGSMFTAYSGTNAGIWDLIGSVDTAGDSEGAYPNDILLGLAVTSHNNNQATRAVFSGFGPALITPSLTISNAGSNIDVSWPSSAIGFTLQASPSLSPVTWTNVPNSAATNRVLAPASAGPLFFRLIQ